MKATSRRLSGGRAPRRHHLVALLVLLCVPAPLARADARGEARRHFQRGMALIREGEVAAGIDELRIANAIVPHPNVQYNIARASLEIERFDDAIAAWEVYLESDPPDAAEVRALIAAVERRRDADLPAPDPGVEAPPAPTPEVGPVVDAARFEEVTTLADETARIARRFRSPGLRRRAERLAELAGQLREEAAEAERRRADAQAAPADEPVPDTPAPAVDEPAPAEPGGRGETAGGLQLLDDPIYDERVVSASRAAESPLDAPNSTTIVTDQDIRLSGLTGVVSLAEMLRRGAGVEVMSLGPSAAEVSIRGLNQRLSNKVLVLVDGRPVNLDFAGNVNWELVPVVVEDVERIEIIRGPASALYGADAFTGVVNVITRAPAQGRALVSVGVGQGDAVHLAGSVAAREGPVAFRVAGGYDRRDAWALELEAGREDLTPFADDEALAVERALLDVDSQIRLGEGLRLDVGNGLAAGQTTFYSVSRFRQSSAQNILFNQAHATLSTDVGLVVRTFWNFFGLDVGQVQEAPGAVSTRTRIDNHVADVDVSWSRTVDLGFPHDLTVGAGYRFKRIEWDWIGGVERQHHFNVYLQDVLRIHERFRVHLSARLDRHPLLDSLQFSPRGALIARPTPDSALRFTVGRAFRSPNFLESYLELQNGTPLRGVTALGLGSEELDPEGITSFELGYQSRDLDVLSIEANVYVNLVDDLILLAALDTYGLEDFASGQVGFADDSGAFPVGTLTYANDRSRLRQVGAELDVHVNPVDGVDLHANYAVHDTTPLDEGSFLAGDDRTPRHKVGVGAQYRSPIGLDASFDVFWVDGQTWVEQVTDSVTGVRFEAFTIPSYTLVNAYVGWRLLDDHLELGASVYDLLDQRHRQHRFGQPVARRFMARVTGRF